MSGGSSATGHVHSQSSQQPQLEDQEEDLFPPDNFSMVDAGIYRSERQSKLFLSLWNLCVASYNLWYSRQTTISVRY